MLDLIFKLACELYQNSHISFKFYHHPFFWWSIHGSRINAWYLIFCHSTSLKHSLIHPEDATNILDYDFHSNIICLLMKLINSMSDQYRHKTRCQKKNIVHLRFSTLMLKFSHVVRMSTLVNAIVQ
jgi:hypothetical protein